MFDKEKRLALYEQRREYVRVQLARLVEEKRWAREICEEEKRRAQPIRENNEVREDGDSDSESDSDSEDIEGSDTEDTEGSDSEVSDSEVSDSDF